MKIRSSHFQALGGVITSVLREQSSGKKMIFEMQKIPQVTSSLEAQKELIAWLGPIFISVRPMSVNKHMHLKMLSS